MGTQAQSLNDRSERLLGPKELAEYVGVPLRTVYQWNHRGTGPKMLVVGKHRRYRRADVDAWLEANADPRSAA